MSFVDHLDELRTRLIRAVIIIFVGFFVCYHFGADITGFLLGPLQEAVGDQGKIVYLGVLDKVLAQFQLAFWCSLILTSPFWFYQVWLFIRPGLYDNEIRVIRPFLLVGLILFWLGILFGYYLVFPFAIETLLDFGVDYLEATLDFKTYLVLSSKVLVFLGVLFQLPNIMVILGFMEIVTKYSLRSIRRYVYVAFAVVSAMLTPPDIITMMGIWVPLICLYEVGILAVAFIVHPYLRKKYPINNT